MSHNDDSSEQQRNHKKRDRWNDNDEEDYDDGEILESDSIVDDNGHAKRLCPATTKLSDSFETRHYSGVEEVATKYNSGGTSDGGGLKNLENKKSREEFERERQIRMAALRGETEIEETSHHHHTISNNIHTTQQQNPLVSNPINNIGNQKNIKKESKRNTRDVVNHSKTADHLGGAKVDGDSNDDDDEQDEDDEAAKAMEELFGITNFGSTKNTKVITNHTSAANGTIAKHLKPRKYRQYMNRKNGFNRPLDNV